MFMSSASGSRRRILDKLRNLHKIQFSRLKANVQASCGGERKARETFKALNRRQIKVITFHITSSLFNQTKSISLDSYFMYFMRFVNGKAKGKPWKHHERAFSTRLQHLLSVWIVVQLFPALKASNFLLESKQSEQKSNFPIVRLLRLFSPSPHCTDNKKATKTWQRMQLSLWQTLEAFVTC